MQNDGTAARREAVQGAGLMAGRRGEACGYCYFREDVETNPMWDPDFAAEGPYVFCKRFPKGTGYRDYIPASDWCGEFKHEADL